MKIYLLMEPDYDGDHFYGAFSSKEKAMGSLAYHNHGLSDENVMEEEVDPPDEGRRSETIKTCFVFADGSIERFEQWGDFDDPTREHFSIHSETIYASSAAERAYGWGDGRTDQEAEENARRGLALLNPVWGVRDAHDGEQIEVRFVAPSRVTWCCPYALHRDLNVARTEWVAFKATGLNPRGIIVEAKP